MACQDGFTLADTVAYNEKHNEENGEENRDGSAYNYSWNCGVEGPTRKTSILELRRRQMRNAMLLLFLSQGTPLLYGGDELENSQMGNNNAYCQDNEISWLDWENLKKYEDIHGFFRYLIHFRKRHPAIMGLCGPAKCGLPEVSLHSQRAWEAAYDDGTRMIGVLFAGYDEKKGKDDIVYLGVNVYWEALGCELQGFRKDFDGRLPSIPAQREADATRNRLNYPKRDF